MIVQLIPLFILLLFIVGTIFGTAALFWKYSADGQDSKNFKRPNKGRRRSDQ